VKDRLIEFGLGRLAAFDSLLALTNEDLEQLRTIDSLADFYRRAAAIGHLVPTEAHLYDPS
jgi:hypothetical protein